MENKQKIHCTVKSCKYNNGQDQKCILESIMVTPTENNSTKKEDESMCSSYEGFNGTI